MPFCSKRCRLLDLGNWADESYRIATLEQPSEFTDADDSDEGPGR